MKTKLSKKSKILKNKKSNNSNNKRYIPNFPHALNPYYVYMVPKMGKEEESKIIECKSLNDNPQSPSHYIYYVHYFNYNRRMDEWVKFEQLKVTDKLVMTLEVERKEQGINSDDEHEGLDQQNRIDHEEVTRLKTINKIKLGPFMSDTWYYSPFPEGYHYTDILYFCEFCLNFFVKESYLINHMKMCKFFYPPGNEIYNDNVKNISIFEVDGFKNSVYCENLCYLSKLFLDHKLLLYSIDLFLFYVLTENDENGYHIVGYFSKNKDPGEQNLSCILTLPFHQRKGYGKFLINFSYELSKIEEKMGTPERPLSDLGRQSYISYWCQQIIDYISELDDTSNLSIQKISKETFIKEKDIIDTFERTEMLKITKDDELYLNLDKEFLAILYKKMGRKAIAVIRDRLHWIPFKFKYDQTKFKNY